MKLTEAQKRTLAWAYQGLSICCYRYGGTRRDVVQALLDHGLLYRDIVNDSHHLTAKGEQLVADHPQWVQRYKVISWQEQAKINREKQAIQK